MHAIYFRLDSASSVYMTSIAHIILLMAKLLESMNICFHGITCVISIVTKFKRHLPGEFHDCSWFWSPRCSRKGARSAEERRKKKKKTYGRNSICTVSRFVALVTILSHLLATVRWGNALRQIQWRIQEKKMGRANVRRGAPAKSFS